MTRHNTILLVSPNPIISSAVALLLEVHLAAKVHCRTPVAATSEVVHGVTPDVTLVDAFTADHASIAVKLRADRAVTGAILVFGVDRADKAQCERWLRAGAVNIVYGDATAAELAGAIAQYLDADCIPPPSARSLNPWSLTRRELDVLALISSGHTNKEIGVRLGISEATVKNHVHSLLGKLGVTSRVQAMLAQVTALGRQQRSLRQSGELDPI